jgi:glyoxylase-like metal-dependent hydrolase (beta-lactamase superfamily II)
MLVDRFVLDRRYAANCWAIRADEAGPAAVVDPGGDPTELLSSGIAVEGILVTHGDVDHIGGVAALVDATGAEVWMPAGEAETLREGRTRGGMQVRAHEPEHQVTGGDRITVAGLRFEVVDVPGHSAGHVAFYADGKLFSGDLLFEQSVGRVDLDGGDWQTLLDSVQRLLAQFGPDATVYPGHGEPTTLGRELATNPFLGALRAQA